MKAIERHRQTWQGKSDEWIFERLDNELKQKVEEIHRLIAENEALRQFDVTNALPTDWDVFMKCEEIENMLKNGINEKLGEVKEMYIKGRLSGFKQGVKWYAAKVGNDL